MIIAANWKMNLTRHEAALLLTDYCGISSCSDSSINLVAFVPACYLELAESKLAGSGVQFGGQDCHDQKNGAFTGDISAQMIAEFGAGWVLCGHSERRLYHTETDSHVAAKMVSASKSGLGVMLCVGESHHDRLAGHSVAIVTDQLSASLRLWREHDVSGQSLAIAYEPVWAIGTGLVASLDQISEMHKAIKTCVANIGLSAPVLYGGSVKPDNAADILSLKHVDGALVGGASLDADGFCQIVKAAS